MIIKLHFLDKYRTQYIIGLICFALFYFVTFHFSITRNITGLPWYLSSKESTCQCRRCKRHGFNLIRKMPCTREWQPTSISLPGKFHGQRSLVSYSSQSWKDLDMIEVTKHMQTGTLLFSFSILNNNFVCVLILSLSKWKK